MRKKYVCEEGNIKIEIIRTEMNLSYKEIYLDPLFIKGAYLLGSASDDFGIDKPNEKMHIIGYALPVPGVNRISRVKELQQKHAPSLSDLYEEVFYIQPAGDEDLYDGLYQVPSNLFFKDDKSIINTMWKRFELGGKTKDNTYLLYDLDVERDVIQFFGMCSEECIQTFSFKYEVISLGRYIEAARKRGYNPISLGDGKADIFVDIGCPEKLMNEITSFIENVPYAEFENEILKTVIGQPEATKIIYSVYLYLRNIARRRKRIINDVNLLAGPSGSGKTELYRAFKEYFSIKIPELPVLILDSTELTESGYKGKNVDKFFVKLSATQTNGVALVFLDEIDKKLVPSITSAGVDSNKAAMNSLLTIVEGNDSTIPGANTCNTMFVLMGSFDQLRETKKNVKNQVGFNSEQFDKEQIHLMELTTDNLLEAGAIPEFVGRISIVVNYQPLTFESKLAIVDKLLLREMYDWECEFEVADEFKKDVADKFDSKYGCRAFRNTITAVVRNITQKICKDGYEISECRVILNSLNDIYYEVAKAV